MSPYEYHSYSDYMNLLNVDLDAAEALLSPLTQSDSVKALDASFLYYNGTMALRSRVALWMQNKEDAVKYANKVFGIKDYTLATSADVNNGDYSFSKEHIFALSYSTKIKDFLSDVYIYEDVLNNTLFPDAFSDIRLAGWKLQENDGEEMKKMTCLKFNLPEDENSSDEEKQVSVPLFRLAEIYLTLMECLDLEEANKLYYSFCEARRCPYKAFSDEAEREQVLTMEYRKEFIGEGQLFYFYKRKGVRNMPRCIRACGSDSYVLPLPRKEVDINY